MRRRRDPEARREAIIAATAELITEIGVDAVTHRMIAARAQVPLGATTQYFETLDDLRAAALQHLVTHVEQQFERMRDALSDSAGSPQALARLVHAALVDAKAVRAERAVVTAAVFDPQLRAVARELSARLIGFLASSYDVDRATAAAVFVDGLLWHTQLHDEPPPLHVFELALTAILGEPRVSEPTLTPTASTDPAPRDGAPA